MKEYLGDSVYVDYDSVRVILTTENGMEANNTIYLEPEVIKSLKEYFKKVGC